MTDDRALQARALARMRAALNYWLVTTMPNGAPHAAPVWGVWLDGALWFGTGDQKARNLASDPRAVVHLDSADDVTMLRGRAEPVADALTIARVADAFREKYTLDGEPFELAQGLELPGARVYRFTPEIGHAWLEGAFEAAHTRWKFAPATPPEHTDRDAATA